jgi:hypothetical protein
LRRERCSWKPPWRARTPTVRDMAAGDVVECRRMVEVCSRRVWSR